MSKNSEYPKNHGKAQIYDQQLKKSHLDPPSRVGLIHNGMSSIYNGRSSISKNLCSKSAHKQSKHSWQNIELSGKQ